MRNTDIKVWLVLSAFCLAVGHVAAAKTVYVDADASGANDGSTWQNAFNHLQDALDSASRGDGIRVAQGVYKPDQNTANPAGSGDRMAAFQLKNGVALRGGYAGFGEPNSDARDIGRYRTVLSGDLNGDDEPNFANYAENSCHVVSGSGTNATAVLDGFTITAGNANRGSQDIDGAGMYNIGGSPVVTNCTFRDNRALLYGGGMFNYMFSRPAVINCIFSGNSAEYGGGMENRYYSDSTVTNCLFTGNAAHHGGGMGNSGASPTVTNCTFSDNWALGRGGGMYNRFDCDLMLTNSILWNNAADAGPEITLWYYCTLDVSYCDIQGGQSQIYVEESSVNWGDGNIQFDPCFAEPGFWDVNGLWVEGDYHLRPGSPCIDTGDSLAIPADKYDLDGDADKTEPIPWDLDRNLRFVDGDDDGNEVVDMGAYEFFVPPMEVAMKLTPQALNPASQGEWIKLHFVLPEGYRVADVDGNEPVECRLMDTDETIESEYVDVFVNEEGLVEVEAGFDRGDFALCLSQPAERTVTVMGMLAGTSGQDFYGTDTIKIINKTFEQIAGLASYWLAGGCAAPDWCGGFDRDEDGTVNFADLATMEACCVEMIAK